VNDDAIRMKLVPNVVFAKSQIGLRTEGSELKKGLNSYRELTDSDTYKPTKKTVPSVVFAKMKGRYDDANDDAESPSIDSKKDSHKKEKESAKNYHLGYIDPLLTRKKKEKLQQVDKKRIEEIAKTELEVYQRFLIYLYNQNKA